MKKLKILGILLDIAKTKKGISGSRSFLYNHLQSKGCVSKLIDPSLSHFQEKMNIIKNFSVIKKQWILKQKLDVLPRHIRSNKLSIIIDKKNYDFNAILQIGSEFRLNNTKRAESVPKFSYHDNNFVTYMKSGFDSVLLKSYKNKYEKQIKEIYNFEKSTYDNLNGIFCMTDYLRKSFIEDFKQPEDKVHTVYFGPNFDLGSINEYVKDYTNKNILFVSKDSFEAKGGIILLQAFKSIRDKYKNAKLIIVGPKQNINLRGVEWVGFADKRTPEGRRKLKNAYMNSSLFVLPSFGEPTGNVFLEAMAFKLPCIGANQGATPEIIISNQCGRVVKKINSTKDLSNTIIEMFENESLMRQYGENGYYAIKKKYNWDLVCNRALSIMNRYL